LDSAELNHKIEGLAIVSRNNADRTAEIQAELEVHLPNVKCVAPKSLDHMHEVVRDSAETAELVVAVGGDGTLHQVLNACDPERQILGILPMGTGNDFARLIGYTGVLADRVWEMSTLRPRPTDFGTVAGFRYLNSAGIGLDSATLARRRTMVPWIARNYTLAFCLTLTGLHPFAGTITAGSYRRHGSFWWLLAMNNIHIGGGTPVAPRAQVDDGKLDMLLVDRITKPAVLALMPRALKGNHLGRSGVYYDQYPEIRIELNYPQQWLALDGELHEIDESELVFKCHPGGIRFLR
jgi:diacylglycerol kinase family enzyme